MRYFISRIPLMLYMVGVSTFLAIAHLVDLGQTQAFDECILLDLRRGDDLALTVGPAWVLEAGRDVSALGGMTVLTLITVAVITYMLLARMFQAMMFWVLVIGGARMLVSLLKVIFHRVRPSIVPHLDVVSSSSFPSAHALLSMVVYLTLGLMLARKTSSCGLKVYFVSMALMLSGLVGMTRLILGVHYPTDVLAGWMAGVGWVMGCWGVARRLQRRGAVEGSKR